MLVEATNRLGRVASAVHPFPSLGLRQWGSDPRWGVAAIPALTIMQTGAELGISMVTTDEGPLGSGSEKLTGHVRGDGCVCTSNTVCDSQV